LGLSSAYPSIHTLLVAPIKSPTRIYGWAALIDKVGAEGFSDEDERLATILAAQVGRIYQNGSLYADVLSHASELEREVSERKRAEEALCESQEHTRRILDTANDPFITMDAAGRITDWNKQAEVTYGWR